ncbi:MAG: DUF72 domain-containing protein [Nitrospiraceae bacterium]|nr:MAG: DUF72 domain-containing protein [Nitrospiraceae bacterium]
MPCVKIGCSGFLYDNWQGTFYPNELSKKQWLEYYCKKFATVELNVTFYRVPEKETFSKWYSETPKDFTISLKGSRSITHVKKLKSPAEPLDVFFSRITALREKLGVVLWQFPPDFKADTGKLQEFLEALSQYHARNAFEFRDKSWMNKKIITLLGRNNIALCFADWPDFLCDAPVTADFVYVRRHGADGKCASCYTTEQLKTEAKAIKKFLKDGKDIFLYFNNEACGYAPKNAKELKNILRK